MLRKESERATPRRVENSRAEVTSASVIEPTSTATRRPSRSRTPRLGPEAEDDALELSTARGTSPATASLIADKRMTLAVMNPRRPPHLPCSVETVISSTPCRQKSLLLSVEGFTATKSSRITVVVPGPPTSQEHSQILTLRKFSSSHLTPRRTCGRQGIQHGCMTNDDLSPAGSIGGLALERTSDRVLAEQRIRVLWANERDLRIGELLDDLRQIHLLYPGIVGGNDEQVSRCRLAVCFQVRIDGRAQPMFTLLPTQPTPSVRRYFRLLPPMPGRLALSTRL